MDKSLKKVLNEKEFKAWCRKKNIVYTARLWSTYMDRAWFQIEKELGVTESIV